MTREKAIKLLANATYSEEWQGNEDLQTAHNMAIEALKQEPSEGIKHDIDKVLATIDFERTWLYEAGYNASNVDIALESIEHDLRRAGRND